MLRAIAPVVAALGLFALNGVVRADPPPGPDVLTEGAGASWGAMADEATAAVFDDGSVVRVGAQSLRFETDGGFDTWLFSPPGRDANWNLTAAGAGLRFWLRAQNTSPFGFQGPSPWVRVYSAGGAYAEFSPLGWNPANDAREDWVEIVVPYAGNARWQRTNVGSPNLSAVTAVEIHADTWDAGFTLWIDGLTFSIPTQPPEGLVAVPLDGEVALSWASYPATAGFGGFRVYRDATAITSVAGRTPIATIPSNGATEFADGGVVNGVAYHYAITAVVNGQESEIARSIGPRKPRRLNDLQVVSIARTPRFPRYAPTYEDRVVTEPGGFGPYHYSAATGLGAGQTAQTQRFPTLGQQVTYTATVRNAGTVPFIQSFNGRWRVDGALVTTVFSPLLVLFPGETTEFSVNRPWTGNDELIAFTVDDADERPANNALAVNARSVGFLSFFDTNYLEDFKAESQATPGAATDDLVDWLNRHMVRFNAMFAAAGSPKRVHFDTLAELNDRDADPAIDTLPYAIFPFRYRGGEGTLRRSGYYNPADEIDFGLLHEMGHQLGLIDLYRLDLPGDRNLVNGQAYSTIPCLMHGVSPFLSAHSAGATTRWYLTAHGYYGQYLYAMPAECRLQIVGSGGQPLAGATVRVYQRTERPGEGDVITPQVKFQGATDAGGVFVLPNVPIDPGQVPPAFNGDALGPNPFGYVAVVGTNGLFLIEVEDRGFRDYAWLDITEVNDAFNAGQTGVATFTRHVALGGTIQTTPPDDMAELNAADWVVRADDGTIAVEDDQQFVVAGEGSIRLTCTGGGDNAARYPDGLAQWDLSGITAIRFSARAVNDNSPRFQNGSPWVRLGNGDGYLEWRPTTDILDAAVTQWVDFAIPVAGDEVWQRTTFGTPDLASIHWIEIHADTWGAGFTLWLDRVGFDGPSGCPLDWNGDGNLDPDDLADYIGGYFSQPPDPRSDLNGDGSIDPDDLADYIGGYFSGAGC